MFPVFCHSKFFISDLKFFFIYSSNMFQPNFPDIEVQGCKTIQFAMHFSVWIDST